MTELNQMEKLSADIDLRLTWLWQQILENDTETFSLVQVAAIARAAYGQGYTDANLEPNWKMHKDNGLRHPVDE